LPSSRDTLSPDPGSSHHRTEPIRARRSTALPTVQVREPPAGVDREVVLRTEVRLQLLVCFAEQWLGRFGPARRGERGAIYPDHAMEERIGGLMVAPCRSTVVGRFIDLGTLVCSGPKTAFSTAITSR